MTRSDVLSKASEVLECSNDPVWLLDVDDTLTDTAETHRVASRSVAHYLRARIDRRTADQVAERFVEIFEALLGEHQSRDEIGGEQSRLEVRALHHRIAACQQAIVAQWGAPKKFSREVLLQLALEDFGVQLSAAELSACAEDYWANFGENYIVFSDASELTRSLDGMGWPIFLFSGSDARLTPGGDGQFRYDPRRSRHDKAARLKKLRPKGVPFRRAFIGDPIDKPNQGFFELIFGTIPGVLERSVNNRDYIVVGDSFRSDLETPLRMGNVGLAVLCDRKAVTAEMSGETLLVTTDLSTITELILGRKHERRWGRHKELNEGEL